MIKKLIIFIVVVLIIWLSAVYYNNKNKSEEIIINENSEQSEKIGTTTPENISDALRQKAQTYCDKENTASVYVSTSTIKVVGSLLGAGTTYINANDNTMFSCPVVAPNYVTQECKDIMNISEQSWQKICEN
ncbi:MAG: hypothetical protein UR79_C0004G0037 [Candidatus Campbellbacteria bacterium GW2011_GWD1_35_49]|nr:MAG: seg [Candidatus Campbellbacteria bacterium GW2011_OD1_34_28]KKP74548.1 MAG: hypothetical protein UR74_C0004G0037 [Candidatus Campbellbacteria bacterium GW2011_GWD2_35_24]KKP76547.1 MAG: hypothetical protein UR76_C0004G0037 [Candidatus Campbellbacteria bacterium GW2011_GWC1_35_31]KKP78586.1 MAG: hypothetical protein UR79_C0004G0037 [Candidatus Campbellbacteria bacterium GW2011_GWD1_35_49]HAP74445.1 hypothetical protein [Candidatus Campbellbacteria bacterium]